jgi:hypothetical protein
MDKPVPRDIPQGARKQVAHYLGAVQNTERALREALILVSERHEKNYELSRGAAILAMWSAEHLRWLDDLTAAYGTAQYEHAELLRSALLGGTRVGTVGELADISDLATLVQHAQMLWTILVQGAKELHDDRLLDTAARARDHSRRQLSWLTTVIEHEAPDAIAVVPDPGGQLAATVPKRASAIASIPDPVWGSLMGGALIMAVGLLGVLVGLPWLVPSIGPSAVLLTVSPAHPTARPWNTIVGHAGGLLAGFAAVALLGAASAPTVLGDHQLVPIRVAAAAIAIALTILVGFLLRASHPPAAASTLLVALGAIATIEQGMIVLGGVLLTAAIGELMRLVRLERTSPGQRQAPTRSLVGERLRGAVRRPEA